MKFVLDDRNQKILTLLKTDSRKSFTEMVKELSLSEGAVRKRIKQLIESKVIERFTIETSQLLHPVRSIVMVKLSPKAQSNKIIEFIRKMAGVNSAYTITGGYDVFVDVGASNTTELQEKIISIRNQKGVNNTLTMTILS